MNCWCVGPRNGCLAAPEVVPGICRTWPLGNDLLGPEAAKQAAEIQAEDLTFGSIFRRFEAFRAVFGPDLRQFSWF